MHLLKTHSVLLYSLFSITLITPNTPQEPQRLIKHVEASIQNAWHHRSKLVKGILDIPGMSSDKVRHLLNNICSLRDASYLEIGVHKGSTFISALYGNTDTLDGAIAIDNWSEFGHQKNTFISYTSLYLPKNSFRFYENNAFNKGIKKIFNKPINIYFYDGNHSAESQCKAFTHFNDILADVFIAIIDDWNWEQVKKGTKQAFSTFRYTVLVEGELPSYKGSDKENWWNGLYIAVIQK